MKTLKIASLVLAASVLIASPVLANTKIIPLWCLPIEGNKGTKYEQGCRVHDVSRIPVEDCTCKEGFSPFNPANTITDPENPQPGPKNTTPG